MAAVAVNALGPFVPARDGAVEVLTDDGILGGVNNGGQARPIIPKLLGGAAVKFLIGAAQVLFDLLTVTDIANGAENRVPPRASRDLT